MESMNLELCNGKEDLERKLKKGSKKFTIDEMSETKLLMQSMGIYIPKRRIVDFKLRDRSQTKLGFWK